VRQIPNYANYPFADYGHCPECAFGGERHEDDEEFEPVGYADTIYGYMAVLRCPHRLPPLVGNRCGKANKTHWILFLK
jgi:hypothetical protein